MAPKDEYVLIHGTCAYGKGELRLQMKLRLLITFQRGRISLGYPVELNEITRVLKAEEGNKRKVSVKVMPRWDDSTDHCIFKDGRGPQTKECRQTVEMNYGSSSWGIIFSIGSLCSSFKSRKCRAGMGRWKNSTWESLSNRVSLYLSKEDLISCVRIIIELALFFSVLNFLQNQLIIQLFSSHITIWRFEDPSLRDVI